MQPIIADRYVLTRDPVREGGMSTVQKVFDREESRLCAIKRMRDPRDDDLRWKESFNREYKALTELSEHPNIVTLHDAGVDDDGHYMVLEWVPSNLVDWIQAKGPLSWDEFYHRLGRPVLQALAFAQSRGWIHRDIKPQNILVTDDGVPKISDYGIAKEYDRPAFGITFSSFRSVPFTPPEDDSREWACSRDCFSWAAVAVYCLTGKVPSDYGSLASLVATLDASVVPVTLLQSALSDDPAERPPLASALLSDLDQLLADEAARQPRKQVLHLQLETSCLQFLMRSFSANDRRDVERNIVEELSEVSVGLKSIDSADGSERGIRISAVTWWFEAFPSRAGRDRWLIVKARPARAVEVERHREAAFRPPLTFSFSPPTDPVRASAEMDELMLQLDAFEAEDRDRAMLQRRERVFRLWYAFLRAKADLEAKRENAISFIDFEVNGARVSLSTELPAPVEIIGQSRVIRMSSGGHVFCEVIDVTLEEVVVSVTSGDPSRIRRRGKLEVNTVAAEKAIERQRRALDAVNYDRAASPRLKSVIVEPESNRPPLTIAAPRIVGPRPFDPEKREVLRHALGVQDVLAIQGPPGTGKTRLIEEILVQYLDRNPRHRVLLSAQTHVALDNVIERVRTRGQSIDIVRIGRMDDPKISSSCRDLVLDRKAAVWSQGVKERAHTYMTDWARDRGIDRESIEVGMMAERLILLIQQLSALKHAQSKADRRVQTVEDKAEEKLAQTGSAESSELRVASVEAQEELVRLRASVARVRSEIEDVRSRLSTLGEYGKELASQGDESELREWSKLLLGKSEDQARCRALLELQEEWMLRVGRSSDFHAAMLASAQVVAGTCIGMAGVRGMDDVAYDLCIVDEASKATVTEILVPMSRSRKWILVGDPAQLPPFFEDASVTKLEEFEEEEVRGTLLDRFLGALPEHSIARLANQHRMVKPIGDLISEAFYDGMLKSPKTKPDVVLPGAFPKPVTWLSTSGMADAGEVRNGQSYQNDAECRVIRDALAQIDFVARKRKHVYDVALIAGYVSQVKALQDVIRDRIHEWTGLKITCSTVDAFQGSEAEFCIYSVTRSNPERRLGFLRESPRLNVALSRGRSGLIIVGDDAFCQTVIGQNPFRKVLDFIEAHPEHCERRAVR